MSRIRLVALSIVLTLGAGASAALAADAANGEKIFKKCAACHSTEVGKTKIGPSLAGLIGRTAGTLEGYKYSKAMVEYGAGGIAWDEAALDAYLTKPREVVKGTKMAFPGLKEQADRADVIAYLAQF